MKSLPPALAAFNTTITAQSPSLCEEHFFAEDTQPKRALRCALRKVLRGWKLMVLPLTYILSQASMDLEFAVLPRARGHKSTIRRESVVDPHGDLPRSSATPPQSLHLRTFRGQLTAMSFDQASTRPNCGLQASAGQAGPELTNRRPSAGFPTNTSGLMEMGFSRFDLLGYHWACTRPCGIAVGAPLGNMPGVDEGFHAQR